VVYACAGKHKQWHEGEIKNETAVYFEYSTDTLGGSSGSPCLDEANLVVALHHALVAGQPLNRGVRMKLIMADISTQYPSGSATSLA
jgi:V8-like Glu-specific endopeptidase